jgi:hypothetical protein
VARPVEQFQWAQPKLLLAVLKVLKNNLAPMGRLLLMT